MRAKKTIGSHTDLEKGDFESFFGYGEGVMQS